MGTPAASLRTPYFVVKCETRKALANSTQASEKLGYPWRPASCLARFELPLLFGTPLQSQLHWFSAPSEGLEELRSGGGPEALSPGVLVGWPHFSRAHTGLAAQRPPRAGQREAGPGPGPRAQASAGGGPGGPRRSAGGAGAGPGGGGSGGVAKWLREHLGFRGGGGGGAGGKPAPPEPDYRPPAPSPAAPPAPPPDILAAYRLQRERDFEDPYSGGPSGSAALATPAVPGPTPPPRHGSPPHRLIRVETPGPPAPPPEERISGPPASSDRSDSEKPSPGPSSPVVVILDPQEQAAPTQIVLRPTASPH
nr:uncharacterized protein LOC104846863 [Loxodonta africana]